MSSIETSTRRTTVFVFVDSIADNAEEYLVECNSFSIIIISYSGFRTSTGEKKIFIRGKANPENFSIVIAAFWNCTSYKLGYPRNGVYHTVQNMAGATRVICVTTAFAAIDHLLNEMMF